MVDILAVCAHPDDLEVCAAGMFAKAKKEGLKNRACNFLPEGKREVMRSRGKEKQRQKKPQKF